MSTENRDLESEIAEQYCILADIENELQEAINARNKEDQRALVAERQKVNKEITNLRSAIDALKTSNP
jgi:hypothetical protein